MKRLFRFRLRTLLVVMALIGGVGGIAAAFHSEYQRELDRMETVFGMLEGPFEDSTYEQDEIVYLKRIPDVGMKVG